MVKWHSAQYLKMTHKFGLELPKTVKEAIAIDEKNGNTLQKDATEKEMENVKIRFQIILDGKRVLNSSKYLNCHMVFKIKIEDFQSKAYLVVGGHMTHTLGVIIYYSVTLLSNYDSST